MLSVTIQHVPNIVVVNVVPDNGKEFIATLVVEMMMRHNPNCFIVTGRPRTPRDQGSVENANKLVKQVLMSFSRQRRMEGIETNWTKILGQVMSVCNSQMMHFLMLWLMNVAMLTI